MNRESEQIAYVLECLRSPEKRKEKTFRDWIKEPANRVLFREIRLSQAAWEYHAAAEKLDISREFSRFRDRHRNRRKRFLLRWGGVAACLLAGIGLGVILNHSYPEKTVTLSDIPLPQRQAELILPGGERFLLGNRQLDIQKTNGVSVRNDTACRLIYQPEGVEPEEEAAGLWHSLHIPAMADYFVQLEDGTRVWLNCESAFEYPVRFGGGERRVRLNGEAYFEVAKATERPFIIETDRMEVVVTGTSLNVKSYAAEKVVNTTLIEGKLEVNGTRLLPGQQYALNKELLKEEVLSVDPELFSGWTKGLFIFKGERLEEVMAGLARWYQVEVIYLDADVKELHFSGSLMRYESIDDLLDVIRTLDKVVIERHERTITIQGKR